MRRLLALFIALVLLPSLASAQATITPSPYQTVLDSNGDPINGACVWTYIAGTSTAAATYTNANAPLVANSNPIIADSAGRYTAYLLPGASYKFIFETACSPPSHGSVFRTADPIGAVAGIAQGVDVVATAGETILAGQCAYLSDGSGSKVAGTWYLCDSTNSYSSTAPTVGLAPADIAMGASGAIRLEGTLTGLSSLVIGQHYYVTNVAGGYAVSGPRDIGQADTTTSMVITGARPLRFVNLGPPNGRLTLTTGVPVTSGNVAAATTLYYTPYLGNQIPLYDGLATWTRYAFTEISIAVPVFTNSLYDVYVYNNAGAPTLELTIWTNDTTRSVALTTQNGMLVKTGATTRLYLGSFRTTAVSGQTEDSLTKRWVWNYYNRVPRQMLAIDTTDSWNYTTAAWRQADGNAANQLDMVIGVAEVLLDAGVIAVGNNSAGGVSFYAGIGEDSTTVLATGVVNNVGPSISGGATIRHMATARLQRYPAVGRHVYTWLEYSEATGTTTWSGDNGGVLSQSGIFGVIQGD